MREKKYEYSQQLYEFFLVNWHIPKVNFLTNWNSDGEPEYSFSSGGVSIYEVPDTEHDTLTHIDTSNNFKNK